MLGRTVSWGDSMGKAWAGKVLAVLEPGDDPRDFVPRGIPATSMGLTKRVTRRHYVVQVREGQRVQYLVPEAGRVDAR